MSFLRAEWRKLIMINYEVNPDVLKPYLPLGTDLDFFQGKCYLSVVGFMFLNTRLLGVKIPFHVNFEEVNLRFYVKKVKDGVVKRGVVFIKEIVPKAAITFVANTVYNENYQTLQMKHLWNIKEDKLNVSYQWKINNEWNSIEVEALNNIQKMDENSEIEFIAEHYWGYSKDNNQTTEYEVKHPKWGFYPVINYKISVNFLETYNKDFLFLRNQKPTSVFLLEGSNVSVENKVKF
ncbi:YqjF family protein [Tenacibaculum sp. nBUS_03]|uniref:YqjF family protein n=1 Tax=Tenacibaculum sp. nBUS_03 TaxID=3395320 RepID=UPI003EB7B477